MKKPASDWVLGVKQSKHGCFHPRLMVEAECCSEEGLRAWELKMDQHFQTPVGAT